MVVAEKPTVFLGVFKTPEALVFLFSLFDQDRQSDSGLCFVKAKGRWQFVS